MTNELKCGTAKRCITPPNELMPNLRGLMNMRYVAVEDDLYVRILAIRSEDNMALFIGYDLDKAPYPQETIAYMHVVYGIPEENITIYGIHTHSAPATGLRPKEAFNDPRQRGEDVAAATAAYEQFILNLTKEAAKEAIENLRPAKVSFASEPCAVNLSRNLVNYAINEDGSVAPYAGGMSVINPADHNVYVTRFADAEGRPIAFIMNYAVHGTIMFQNEYDDEGGSAISGDIGGSISAMVEKFNPGAVALWCSGAAGDMGPMRFGSRGGPNRNGEKHPGTLEYIEKYENLQQAVTLHYAAFVKAVEKMSFAASSAEVRGAVEFVEVPARKLIRKGQGMDAKVTIDNDTPVPPIRIRLHLLRIGELVYIGIGGELYSSLARAVCDALPLKNVVVINHDASLIDDANYIPDDYNISLSDASGKGRKWSYKPGYVLPALVEASRRLLSKIL